MKPSKLRRPLQALIPLEINDPNDENDEQASNEKLAETEETRAVGSKEREKSRTLVQGRQIRQRRAADTADHERQLWIFVVQT